MVFRAVAVLILECMLFVHTSNHPVRSEGLQKALNVTLDGIGIMIDNLSALGLLPDNPCRSVNATMLLGPEQQPLTDQLSTFRCYLEKFSEVVYELSEDFMATVQRMKNMEELQNAVIVSKNCSLPPFADNVSCLSHAKCFLEVMKERIHNSNF